MADGIELNAGAGGAKVLTDDTGATGHAQVVKLAYSADGDATLIPADGTGLDVDVKALPATPAGDNVIGRVKISDGTDVALVSAAGNLMVDGSGVTQPVSGTVTANLSATDNAVLDNIDADTSAIQAAVELLDDAVVADDAAFTPATTKVVMAGFQFDDTLPDSVDEGDAGAARMSARREVYTQIRDAAGNERGAAVDASNRLTVVADLGATDNAVLDNIDADLTTIIGHVDGLEGLLTTIDADTSTLAAVDYATGADVASLGVTGGGVEATALRVTLASDSTGVVSVDDNGASLTVDNAGLTALNGAISGTEVQVDVVGALPAGSNAIGKLAANSGVDIGDVDVTSISAGTNVIGATFDVSGLMIENAVSVTVKYASIDAASSGDNTLVAAVTNKKIRVLSVFLVAAGAVNVRFESGAGGTALTGQMNLVANTGFVLPYNPHGWFQTADSTLLNLELSGAVSVDGSLTYIEAE